MIKMKDIINECMIWMNGYKYAISNISYFLYDAKDLYLEFKDQHDSCHYYKSQFDGGYLIYKGVWYTPENLKEYFI